MWTLYKKEIRSFLGSLIAYLVMGVYLIMTGLFLWFVDGNNLFDLGVASLQVMFDISPFILIFLVSAITMRSISEEKRLGTIELLLTLPIPLWKIILSKFFSTWLFVIFSIILTFPIWITVNYLGNPDNLIIVGQYLGVIIMSGAYISLGIFFSSLTNNQIVAFILSILFSFLFTISGFPLMINFITAYLSIDIVELISSFSFLTHFSSIQTGFFSIKGLLFFISFTALWNYLTILKFMNRD